MPLTPLEDLDEFGRMVRTARQMKGWNQKALAKRLKVVQTYISAIEQGEGEGESKRQIDVKASVLVRLSKALGLNLDVLTRAAARRGHPSSGEPYDTKSAGIAIGGTRQHEVSEPVSGSALVAE